MKCKFCASTKCYVKKNIVSSINQEIYSLYSCKNCMSFFFNKDQHNISLENLYDDLSKKRGNFPEQFSPNKSWQRQAKLICQLMEFPLTSILDIGCRTGDFLLHFDPKIKREGIELSRYFSSIAQNRGLKIHRNFVENIKFDYKFDVVTCYAILEHIEYPIKFLNKINTLINTGGLLVVLIPTHQCLKRKWLDKIGGSWHMYSPPEHLNFFSRKFLDQYLNNRGFQLIHRFYSSGGMIDPFPKIKIINKLAKKIVEIGDYGWLKKYAIFDHMYSYYLLEKN